MLQKILEKVIDTMTPYLDEEQVEKLGNVLYINFHDVEVKKECYELKPTGISGNAAKLDLFIKSKLAINRQSGTMKQYAREIWAALNFIGKDIDDIRAADIRYYFGYLREVKKLKMSTIQTRMHYLSSFWDFLTAEEITLGNPMKKIGTVKVEKIIKKPFSVRDMEALRSNCKRIRDRALMEFLYSTGVRISEAVSLNVGDIDMEHLELIVYGKGSKERKTYLTESAKFYLDKYLKERCLCERITFEELKKKPLFVGSNKNHKRMTDNGVQDMLRTLGKRAGVEMVHPHRFRRTIATDLLSKGMPIEQVRDFLGHEKLDTTLIYCTVQAEEVKASHRKCA